MKNFRGNRRMNNDSDRINKSIDKLSEEDRNFWYLINNKTAEDDHDVNDVLEKRYGFNIRKYISDMRLFLRLL